MFQTPSLLCEHLCYLEVNVYKSFIFENVLFKDFCLPNWNKLLLKVGVTWFPFLFRMLQQKGEQIHWTACHTADDCS